MNYPSSLTSLVFKSSLLYVSLLSTFYIHFSFPLLLFTVSFLLIYPKMTSCERSVQAKKQLEKEVIIKQNGLQNEDDKILDDDQSQYEKDVDHNVFDCDLRNGDKFKSDSDNLSSNMSLDSMSEVDVEEDCLIEILPLPEAEERKRNELNKELLDLLQEEGTVEDLLSDDNEIGGEDNLIEIDISMGSIRQSGCGIGT